MERIECEKDTDLSYSLSDIVLDFDSPCRLRTADHRRHTATAGAFAFVRFGPTGISGDQQYLYVMAGGKILEYQLTDMTLLRSVALPDPGPPGQISTSSTATGSGKFPPPPPPMPHGLWAGNGSLYVLQGPSVYTYSVPDLTLQNTVQLPKPELPQTGN